MAEELTAMLRRIPTKVASDPALMGRVVALLHDKTRTAELVAAVFGHVVTCSVIQACFPGICDPFDSAIFRESQLFFSSFNYPGRLAWTMHALVTDDCVSFCCNTVGSTKDYTIRFPRAKFFKRARFGNVAACFNDKVVLALSGMLTSFVCCDSDGDFTVNY